MSIAPAVNTDIQDSSDVEKLIRKFYGEVAQDAVLGPVFNDVAQVDWSAHIPKLIAFWNRALFDVQGYVGNPFQTHKTIHERSPFRPEHFERWLELFHENVDAEFSGPRAESAKALARNVARVHSTQLLGEPVHFDPPTT